MIAGVHHVAYVVADLDAAARELGRRYGMRPELRQTMADQGVEALMLEAGHGRVELIRPLADDGPVARFLAARGGLHHVAYAVPDIAAALELLRADGAELIDERARPGIGGHLVAFVHPRSGLGALTELVQASG